MSQLSSLSKLLSLSQLSSLSHNHHCHNYWHCHIIIIVTIIIIVKIIVNVTLLLLSQLLSLLSQLLSSSQLSSLSHYHHCHNYHYCQNYCNFLNYHHCHNYSNFNIYSIYLKLIQNDKLEMNIPWCCSSLNQLPPKNNRIRGGRRKKLKSSWEIKRNYANWNYLREIMQIDENFLFDFNSPPDIPLLTWLKGLQTTLSLFCKIFLSFVPKRNC